MVKLRLIFILSFTVRSVLPTSFTLDNYIGDEKTKISFTVDECDDAACKQSCRRLEFFEGICIGTRCDCHSFWTLDKILKDLDNIAQDNNKVLETQQNVNRQLSNCDKQICNHKCQLVGSSSGVCENGYCVCDNIKVVSVKNSAKKPASIPTKKYQVNLYLKCNRECFQNCRSFGHQSGACVKGNCICNQFKGDETTETPTTQRKVLSELDTCNKKDCHQKCQQQESSRGICVKNTCKCDKFKGFEVTNIDDKDTISNIDQDDDFHKCDRDCHQECLSFGFTNGVCINGNCNCKRFNEFINITPRRQENELKSCDNRACHQNCQQIGSPSGLCNNGYCKCDEFKVSSDQVINSNSNFEIQQDVSELSKNCVTQECNQACQVLGYSWGICLNGNCDCNQSKNADNKAENIKGFYKIDKDTDEFNKCNRECYQYCRRVGHSSGVCISGECDCVISRDFELNSTSPRPQALRHTPQVVRHKPQAEHTTQAIIRKPQIVSRIMRHKPQFQQTAADPKTLTITTEESSREKILRSWPKIRGAHLSVYVQNPIKKHDADGGDDEDTATAKPWIDNCIYC